MNNNSTIRVIVSLFLGAGLGFGAGFLFGKNKYLKKADSEIESVKSALQKHYEDLLNSKGEDNPEPQVKVEQDPIIEEQTQEDIVVESGEEINPEEKKKYVDYAKKYSGEQVKNKPVAPKKKLKETIQKLITDEEFNNSEFVAKGYTYYVENDLFVDELDQPLPVDDNTFESHIKDLIRERANNKGTMRPEILYIRDESRKVDYEINFEYDLKYVSSDESAG